MFLQGRLPKTLVEPMFLHWCLQKTLVLPMFSALGAENIGKTNKNHKNQDFQTNTWNLQPIVWKSWFFMVFIGFADVFCSSGRKTLVKPMFLQGRLPKTLVEPMFLQGRLHKTLAKPMFLQGWLHKTLVLPMFSFRGAENIGKTNKKYKNQDFQTMGWRLQI